MSMLHNMDLIGTQMPTMTIKSNNTTQVLPKIISSQTPGETITISKTPSTNVGETIVLKKSSIPHIPDVTSTNKTIVLSTNGNPSVNSPTNENTDLNKSTNQEKENDDDLEVIDIDTTTTTSSMKTKDETVQNAWSEGNIRSNF